MVPLAPMSTQTDNRSYYDAFARRYDVGRDVGYHKLIDDQAAAIVSRHAAGKEALEVGCGTGLILERVAAVAAHARGIDLSPGMLEAARARGLDVEVGDATKLRFDDNSFDVAYSFKVLAHIPGWERCVAEMVRVVRPGGVVIFDVYNRHSLRYLIKRLWGPRKTSDSFDEGAIATNFYSPEEAKALLPANTRVIDEAGIRITIPHPAVCRLPVVGGLVERAEWAAMGTPLARLAGFYVLVVEKVG
ncbi:MAG: methyltransferase domain-containing protein [Myxococcales bacterium]|nr:methyltransferase domain-containing protein [Myxococcales bacterium]MCB9700459.1 methyltransferase domain-containing protein [Myxococcales bacterium]